MISIAYDVWQLFHPTVDVWVGKDINASATYSGGKLAIDIKTDLMARLHWSFCLGLLRFEYQRAVTGGIVAADQCVLQFHKSRLFRDVNIDVQ